MVVKIDDKLYDTSEVTVLISLSEQEKHCISASPKTDDMFIFFPKNADMAEMKKSMKDMKSFMKHHARGRLYTMSTKELITLLRTLDVHEIGDIPLLECLDSQLIKKIEESI